MVGRTDHQEIEALTGEAARRWLVARDDALKDAAAALRASPEDVPARLGALLDERKRLERELADARRQLALGGGGAASGPAVEDVAGVRFSGQVIEGLEPPTA